MSRTAPMSSAERAPRILCAGIIVLDEVFRVSEFPQPDGKVQANGFFVVNGGCAANAAVAIARFARRSDGRPGGRGRQRRSCAAGVEARKSRLLGLSAHRWLGDRALGDLH